MRFRPIRDNLRKNGPCNHFPGKLLPSRKLGLFCLSCAGLPQNKNRKSGLTAVIPKDRVVDLTWTMGVRQPSGRWMRPFALNLQRTVIPMKMKKIVIGLLGLAVVAAGVPQVQAWCCWRRCCCKYSTYICCKPYNAFTPCCYGSICCNGCCPMQFSCGGCSSPCCPSPCCGPTIVSSNCCDGGWGHPVEPAPFAPGYQPMPAPGPGPAPNWVPPAPVPMVGQAPMWNMPAVQQTGYFPGYYPSYQPQAYWSTMPVAAPSYWYGR